MTQNKKEAIKHAASHIVIGILWCILHIIVLTCAIIFTMTYGNEMENTWLFLCFFAVILLCILTIAPYLFIRDSIIQLIVEVKKNDAE